MRLSRNQLRNILIRETKNILKEASEDSTSIDSLKELGEYLAEKNFKYNGIGFGLVIYEIGDQLIDKIKEGDLEGAFKLFVERYSASGF